MWQIHMQTGRPRMDAEAISGTAQILCGRGLTPAWRWGPALSSQMLEVAVRVCLSLQEWRVQLRLEIDKNQEKNGQSVQTGGRHPTHRTQWSLHQLGFLPRVNEADSCSKDRPNWNGGFDCSESSPEWPPKPERPQAGTSQGEQQQQM